MRPGENIGSSRLVPGAGRQGRSPAQAATARGCTQAWGGFRCTGVARCRRRVDRFTGGAMGESRAEPLSAGGWAAGGAIVRPRRPAQHCGATAERKALFGKATRASRPLRPGTRHWSPTRVTILMTWIRYYGGVRPGRHDVAYGRRGERVASVVHHETSSSLGMEDFAHCSASRRAAVRRACPVNLPAVPSPFSRSYARQAAPPALMPIASFRRRL